MGYYITVRGMDFTLKEKNFDKALEAIKELEPHGWCRGNARTAQSLWEAMSCWRWTPEVNPKTGDIDYLYFDGEKLGDDEEFFNKIAPFVEEDSYIEISGEEGAIWRWCFKNGTIKEQSANISWE
jgi:hypothetical protein